MPDAFALPYGAFEARLTQAVRLMRMRLKEPPDDADEDGLRKLEGDDTRPYTGLLI